jgi:hypothetical protein
MMFNKVLFGQEQNPQRRVALTFTDLSVVDPGSVKGKDRVAANALIGLIRGVRTATHVSFEELDHEKHYELFESHAEADQWLQENGYAYSYQRINGPMGMNLGSYVVEGPPIHHRLDVATMEADKPYLGLPDTVIENMHLGGLKRRRFSVKLMTDALEECSVMFEILTVTEAERKRALAERARREANRFKLAPPAHSVLSPLLRDLSHFNLPRIKEGANTGLSLDLNPRQNWSPIKSSAALVDAIEIALIIGATLDYPYYAWALEHERQYMRVLIEEIARYQNWRDADPRHEFIVTELIKVQEVMLARVEEEKKEVAAAE